jgi:hypothetical protein
VLEKVAAWLGGIFLDVCNSDISGSDHIQKCFKLLGVFIVVPWLFRRSLRKGSSEPSIRHVMMKIMLLTLKIDRPQIPEPLIDWHDLLKPMLSGGGKKEGVGASHLLNKFSFALEVISIVIIIRSFVPFSFIPDLFPPFRPCIKPFLKDLNVIDNEPKL